MRRGVGIAVAASACALVLATPAGAAVVGPATNDYGSLAVGSSSAATSFTLTNSGQICTVPDPVTPGLCDASSSFFTDTSALGTGPGGTITSEDFVIHNVTCPYPSFASTPAASDAGTPPDSCQFQVSFAPVTGGPRAKTLTFSDSPNSTATLTLTGTGIAPASTAAPPPQATATAPPKKRCKKKRHRAAAAKKCKHKKG
jgi:hypothetical protein